MKWRHIVYMNAHKEVSALSISANFEDDTYLFTYCHQKHRPTTLRKDRIIKEFDNFTDALEYANSLPESEFIFFDEKINSQRRELLNTQINQALTFCFSGFSRKHEVELEELAKAHNLRTVSSVSSKTDFFVICENSDTIGPTKLAIAKEHNIPILYEEHFLHLLETGELPEKGIGFGKGFFNGQILSFAGKFENDVYELKAWSKKHGAYVYNKVIPETSLVIIGGLKADSKMNRALNLNIQTMSENDFITLLNQVEMSEGL